jgi:tetratricopeptide (TPR) repeat protein
VFTLRRTSCVLILCAVIIGSPMASASAGQRRSPGSGVPLPAVEQVPNGRIERLERWLKAVARHAPGEDDRELEDIATFSNEELRGLWIDANVLVQVTRLRRGQSPDRFSVRPEGQKSTQIIYTRAQAHRLRVLACAAGGVLIENECTAIQAADELDPEFRQIDVLARAARLRGDDNYIVRRGAILHSDVAVLAPLSMTAPITPAMAAGPQRFRMEISDGREVGLHLSGVHWEIARMLLDFVRPGPGDRAEPERDEMVRHWYRATAAWMQQHEDHDKLHLDRARALFPSDPDILFLTACQRETFAGPPIQAAVRSAVLATGVSVDVSSERTELREAETLFRRTLEIRPDYVEARMRHGRVLALLGRHAEAAAELRRALGELRDDQLQYYAGLFLGAEEEALGDRDAARAAYERAAALAPNAQSPLLALSQLARRGGDRAGALRAIARMFALAIDDPHDDPWWWYYVDQGRDGDSLLDAVRRPFLSERLQ